MKKNYVTTLALQDENNYLFLLIGNNQNGSFISVEDSVASVNDPFVLFYRFSI